MPAILKSEISAISAAQFVNTIYSTDGSIYIAVARDAAYPWDNENVPTLPKDTLGDEKDFRSKIIGIKRCTTNNIMLMMPRVQWEPGKEFNLVSDTTTQGKRAQDWYCITTNNYVYQCIGKNAPGLLTTVGAEPDLKLAKVDTADGYSWKFLYDITVAMVNRGVLLDAWMPVPYNINGIYPGGTMTESQNLYGDKHANFTMGAYRVLISVKMEDEGDAIPFDTEYRSIALLYNPLSTTGQLLTANNYGKTEFDTNSGQMFFLENRRVTYRTDGQSEELQCLLSF